MITCHFLDVGQGNMALVIMPDGFVIAYDCNITNDNEKLVFAYLQRVMAKNSIDYFVNSHRDADHMRGIKKLHAKYPIGLVLDSGVSGNTDTTEYKQYMELRRLVGSSEVSSNSYLTKYPFIRFLNGKREDLSDINAQSIVMHIDHGGSSLLLAGDTDVDAWKDYICEENPNTLSSLVLYASWSCPQKLVHI